MKAVLEFEFPKDDVEFYWATNGATMNLVLWKMNQWLRGQIKHPPEHMSDGAYDRDWETNSNTAFILL